MKPRFSLLTIFLCATIVALSLVIWRLYREIAPLRAENRELRKVTGELYVDDPTQFYSVQAPQPDKLTWRWRVWVPEGYRYGVRVARNSVPKEAFPSSAGMIHSLEPGESTVTFRIFWDPKQEAWLGVVSLPTQSIEGMPMEWVKWKQVSSSTAGVFATTAMAAPGDRVLLIRHRVFDDVNDPQQTAEPAAGFMIWLDPLP
jgi:hypothetical protein